MTQPLVSVTIPFWNSERFLDEAVSSVFAQRYAEWELILADDGSTDSSSGMARQLAEKHPSRVRYVEHPGHAHRGMGATRNLGLLHSRGDFIARLDSDDVLEPEHLTVHVDVLRGRPDVVMTYGPMKVWNSWFNGPGQQLDYDQRFTFNTDRTITPPELVLLLLGNRNDPQGVLLRRHECAMIGGYDESIQLYEDMTLYCKIALRYPVHVTSFRTYRYRQHQDSYCSIARATGIVSLERLRFLEWLEHHIGAMAQPWQPVRRRIAWEKWKLRHPLAERLATLSERGRSFAVRTLARVQRLEDVRSVLASAKHSFGSHERERR